MKNIKLVFALSLLLACSSVYCQSIQIGPTVYEMHLEWPVDQVKDAGNYTKKILANGKYDNFAIKLFSSSFFYVDIPCKLSQENLYLHFNPMSIKPVDYKYLSNYVGFQGMYDPMNTLDRLKHFYEFQMCSYNKSQTQFFCDLTAAHKKLSIVKTLESQGIVPSKTKFYNYKEFYSALKTLFGDFYPRLLCNPLQTPIDDQNRNDFYGYITGIVLSLDENLNVTKDSQKLEFDYQLCTFFKGFLYLPL